MPQALLMKFNIVDYFSAAAAKAPMGPVIAVLVLALLSLVLLFIARRRLLKILFACSCEVCLFFACKMFFGDEALLTKIMCWVTALAACVVTVAIVNRINWNNIRGRR